jgi:uncharacterized protein (DUF1684 family)
MQIRWIVCSVLVRMALFSALLLSGSGPVTRCVFGADAQAAPDYVASVKQFHAGWDATMRDPRQSPLKPTERARFHGISWFPIQSSYRVTTRFTQMPGKQTLTMRTSSGETVSYVRVGVLTFTLKGQPCRLNAYQTAQPATSEERDADTLFIPFTDATSGHESYGGGRYIEVPRGKANTITLDFNLAYNPYCAYTTGYSCPIPPQENHLSIAVKAGARAYRSHAQ